MQLQVYTYHMSIQPTIQYKCTCQCQPDSSVSPTSGPSNNPGPWPPTNNPTQWPFPISARR